MKRQSRSDRLDESLGERRGKESGKKQSYADRRHESEGSRKHGDHSHHAALHEHHLKEAMKHAKHMHRHVTAHDRKVDRDNLPKKYR